MSDSYPIRALALESGIPYDKLLMASDILPRSVIRHRREPRECEFIAFIDLALGDRYRIVTICEELDRIERRCHPLSVEKSA